MMDRRIQSKIVGGTLSPNVLPFMAARLESHGGTVPKTLPLNCEPMLVMICTSPATAKPLNREEHPPVEKANTPADDDHQRKGQPGRHPQADKIEKPDIGGADHERNRKIEPSHQRHQSLADAGNAQERRKQQNGLDVGGVEEALDGERADHDQ